METLERKGWYFSQVPEEIFCHPTLGDGAIRLFTYLAYRQGANEYSWPSMARMAADLHKTEPTIRRYCRELQAAGYLKVTERPGHSNHYTLYATVQKKDTPVRKGTPIKNDTPTPVKNNRGTPVKNDTHNNIHSNDIHTNDTQIRRALHVVLPKPQAIQAIKRVSNLTPPKVIHPRLATIIGDVTPDKEELLRKCFVEWRLKGYKGTNFGWVTDWFAKGGPQAYGANQATDDFRGAASDEDDEDWNRG